VAAVGVAEKIAVGVGFDGGVFARDVGMGEDEVAVAPRPMVNGMRSMRTMRRLPSFETTS